jgi:hypothetical protein
MRKPTVFFTFLLVVVHAVECHGQPCGSVQSLSSLQQSELNSLEIQLDTALVNEDFSAIDSLNNLIKSTFGNEGGNHFVAPSRLFQRCWPLLEDYRRNCSAGSRFSRSD